MIAKPLCTDETMTVTAICAGALLYLHVMWVSMQNARFTIKFQECQKRIFSNVMSVTATGTVNGHRQRLSNHTRPTTVCPTFN